MRLEQGRADRANPPCLQAIDDAMGIRDRAGDAEQAAGERHGDGLSGEHPLQMALRVSSRPQDADLPQPLFDPEPEEQHHEQQRRDDDEEAEVGEVLAEVGGAGRGAERERADGGDGDALRVWREPLLQVLLQRRRQLAGVLARPAH